jgi:hypothetical protein
VLAPFEELSVRTWRQAPGAPYQRGPCLVGQGANSAAGTLTNSTNSLCSVGDAQFYRYVPPTVALWSAGGIDASAR